MKCRKHKVDKIKTHSYFPYREHWTCMECINDMLVEDNKRKALLKAAQLLVERKENNVL